MTAKEIWKDVVGYEGVYTISNKGEVRNATNKLLSLHTDIRGYKKVSLYSPRYKKKNFLVHRLVAIAFIPNPDNKPCINHIDCVTSNNVVKNLEWCTQKENMQYMSSLNRGTMHMSGKRSGKSNNKRKCTVDNSVFETVRDAARFLGIHECTASKILNNTSSNKHNLKYI